MHSYVIYDRMGGKMLLINQRRKSMRNKLIILATTLVMILAMTITSFADVTVTKEWEDGLTGTAASSREAPAVNLEGSTPYEQLLNLMWPVGSVYETVDASFNPNVAWGGSWQKIESGRFLQATTGADVGTKMEAGLPNITGGANTRSYGESGGLIENAYGAIQRGNTYYFKNGWSTAWQSSNGGLVFDASKSNSIYGNSTTVQPASIKVVMWKRTA